MQMHKGEDEEQKCYIIDTFSAIYYYQIKAGAFSSILDKNGNDWINYKETHFGIPGDACGNLRGLPGLVRNVNIGCPGSELCSSNIEKKEGNFIITSYSADEAWLWQWHFYETHAILKILAAPVDRKYWFLYAGTPGGCFNPGDQFWGTNKGGARNDTPEYSSNSAPPETGDWKWIYTGCRIQNRCFYLHQLTSGDNSALFCYMGGDKQGLAANDGMVLAGLGYGPGHNPQLTGKNDFMIGFLETMDHRQIAKSISYLTDNSF